ncbi:MAG: hypothetical protein AAFV53_21130, partial [Myxococcota bacterium]
TNEQKNSTATTPLPFDAFRVTIQHKPTIKTMEFKILKIGGNDKCPACNVNQGKSAPHYFISEQNIYRAYYEAAAHRHRDPSLDFVPAGQLANLQMYSKNNKNPLIDTDAGWIGLTPDLRALFSRPPYNQVTGSGRVPKRVSRGAFAKSKSVAAVQGKQQRQCPTCEGAQGEYALSQRMAGSATDAAGTRTTFTASGEQQMTGSTPRETRQMMKTFIDDVVELARKHHHPTRHPNDPRPPPPMQTLPGTTTQLDERSDPNQLNRFLLAFRKRLWAKAKT